MSHANSFHSFDGDQTMERPIIPQFCQIQHDKKEDIGNRHKVLGDDDLDALSDANTEKSTIYVTTWAAKTFKGKIFFIRNVIRNEGFENLYHIHIIHNN